MYEILNHATMSLFLVHASMVWLCLCEYGSLLKSCEYGSLLKTCEYGSLLKTCEYGSLLKHASMVVY